MRLEYASYSHAKGINFWHLEWCTKYRYRCMRKTENKNMVEAAIRKAASEAKIQIHNLEVMPEHVHALVTLPRGTTDSEALRRLKGRSAYLIFRHKPNFRLRYPKGHFWSRGSFATTVGFADYRNNKQLHKKSRRTSQGFLIGSLGLKPEEDITRFILM